MLADDSQEISSLWSELHLLPYFPGRLWEDCTFVKTFLSLCFWSIIYVISTSKYHEFIGSFVVGNQNVAISASKQNVSASTQDFGTYSKTTQKWTKQRP